MTTAAQLRERFAEENIEELLELLNLAAKLSVKRDDFEPPAAPEDGAECEQWEEYSDELIEFADKIDDNLVDAQAEAEQVATLAERVRKNLGL